MRRAIDAASRHAQREAELWLLVAAGAVLAFLVGIFIGVAIGVTV